MCGFTWHGFYPRDAKGIIYTDGMISEKSAEIYHLVMTNINAMG